jgi:hypothetical protein
MPIVVKGDGSTEEFDSAKLERSLRHAGADENTARDIASHLVAEIDDGMSTDLIYRHAFKLLRRDERVVAARYSMRRAILDLGPTGFPFEEFFGEVMRAKGYKTKTEVIVKGRCVEHEVDVVLEKDGKTIGAELKFHNTPGYKTDLKTALYVRARYWDIEWGAQDRKEKAGIDEGWLVTNTKFTSVAIEYAECAGIRLLGWNYPRGHGLADLIRETGVYPVTVLTGLSNAEKKRLMQEGVTLCTMVSEKPEALARAGISPKKIENIIAESKAVCGI